MAVKESIHIYEKVTVFIKDANGKVTERVIKKPWKEKTLWEKLLTILGLKKEPGTLNADGITALAKLYGGYATGTTHAAIAYVASYNATGPLYYYQAVSSTWSTPTLTYSNASSPWDSPGTYTNIYLTDIITGFRPYHTIGLGGGSSSVTITTGYSWWVEVKLTFSGS